MNITLDRDPFLAAMQRVIGAVDRRSTIQAITHIGIDPHTDGISLLATNLDMQARTTCAATGDMGSFTLPAHTLLDILNNLSPGAQIVLERDKKDPRIVLKSGRSRFKLPTLDRAAMPEMVAPTDNAVAIPDFQAVVANVGYAMSTDATRYMLCGVHIHTLNGNLVAVATDGHRLATDTATPCEHEIAAILPNTFVRLAEKIEGAVTLAVSESRVCVSGDNIEIVSKLVDGKFPDYQRVIPRSNNLVLGADRKALISAVRRAMIVTGDKARSVRLDIDKGSAIFRARNADSGEGETEVEVDWSGEKYETGFNGLYLVETMERIDSEIVEIKLGDKASPIMIEHDGGVHVLMPLRV